LKNRSISEFFVAGRELRDGLACLIFNTALHRNIQEYQEQKNYSTSWYKCRPLLTILMSLIHKKPF